MGVCCEATEDLHASTPKGVGGFQILEIWGGGRSISIPLPDFKHLKSAFVKNMRFEIQSLLLKYV